jgi:hypothetical protein
MPLIDITEVTINGRIQNVDVASSNNTVELRGTNFPAPENASIIIRGYSADVAHGKGDGVTIDAATATSTYLKATFDYVMVLGTSVQQDATLTVYLRQNNSVAAWDERAVEATLPHSTSGIFFLLRWLMWLFHA